MTLMKKDSIIQLRRVSRKMDFRLGHDQVHALLNHGIDACVRIEQLEGENTALRDELRWEHSRSEPANAGGDSG